MRLGEVFRYELDYRVRSGSTWLFALFLMLVVMWGTGATAEGSSTEYVNAPHKIATAIVLFGGLFGLLVSASLFGDAATRDAAAGMDPLLYTTRVTRGEYLGGRFLAALVVNAVVALALPLGHLAAMLLFFRTSGELGPLRLAAYVQPTAFYVLPNLVLVGAILFAIGTLTRRVVPVFLAAIGILIGTVTAANYWQDIDDPLLSALGDPFGINAVLAKGRFLTPAELNERLIGLPPVMLLNRVVWLAVAVAVLAALYRAFRFAHADASGARRRTLRRAATVAARDAAPRGTFTSTIAARRAAGTFGLRTRLRQTVAVARRAFGDVVSGVAFRVALVGAAGVVLLMGWNVTATVFETPTWPVTQLVAGTVLAQRIAILPWVLIILYAGELVWGEREVGAAEIADAAPVPDAVAVLGRFLALSLVIAAVLLMFVVGGILMQTLQGYTHFELGVYARVVAIMFADYVLLAALVMAVHVLVNQKYVGHVVALSAAVFTKAAPALGLRHHLLLYDTDPGWTYSDMNGFGPFVAPLVWFKLYWAAWALLLGVLAVLFWVRGRESGWRRRLLLARARLAGPVARAAVLGTTLVAALGGFVFYNTNVRNEYTTAGEAGATQAAYETRYARFARTPQPTITDATLRVELYPDDGGADLRGTYRLVNETAGAIDSVHIYLDPTLEARAFSFDRPARPTLTDSARGYRIFALGRALAPGDSLQLTFDVALRRRGFTNGALPTDVAGNGTYFGRQSLPFVGYQPAFELRDAATRKRFGLAPQSPMPGPDDAEARRHREQERNADRVRVHAVIGTDADQTAITTGVLRRSWVTPSASARHQGRRYFEYASEGPTGFGVPIFSGRYAIVTDAWTSPSGRRIPLQIFHHPDHRYDLAAVMRSMKASLDYYSRELGPYPYSQLRVVEVPPYTIFGRAHAGTIAFSEAALFSRSKPGEMDQAFYGTAHEIGHQWQVSGAVVRGIGFLGESFANYGAVMVTEATLGREAARRAYDTHMDLYLRGRSTQSREVPALDVSDQTYIMYRKGPVALLTLRDFLGADSVNAALRRYLATYRDAGPPYPTALDQYAELRAVTPDSLTSLLTDLFETVTLWDVKTERATVRPTVGGAYEVALDVVARKVRADSAGNEKEVPMNDLVEIGVFADGDASSARTPLYLRRHRVRSGRQTIAVTVPRRPARAGVDPFHKLIDRDRENNVVDVAAGGAGSRPGAP